MWKKFFLVFCVLGAIPWQWAANAGPNLDVSRRMALVIGNGTYRDKPLANPANDARAMAAALKSLGFQVTAYTDLDGPRMREAIRDFNRHLQASGGVGLFYFAGHGFQVADKTLLLPVDADSRSAARLLTRSISLGSVLEGMAATRPGRRNLVILDTCLDQPFGPFHRPAGQVPEDTLVAYATRPGSGAADGRRHGIFTAEVLRALAMPGQDIDQVFRQVVTAVGETTGMRQVPWVSSSLPAGFRLAARADGSRTATPAPAFRARELVAALDSRGILPVASAEQSELVYWKSIKDSPHPEEYESYLQAYPTGHFASLARGRIERLSQPASRGQAPVSQAAPPAPVVKPPRRKPRPATTLAKAAPAPAAVPEGLPATFPPPTQPAPVAAEIKEYQDCPVCPAMVELPGGLFTMGSDRGEITEQPVHSVALGGATVIGKYEVTVGQWDACTDAGACPPLPEDSGAIDTEPVRNVSWDDAQEYVRWLSRITGRAYRLPTEAEWEYAARGGTSSRYWWGERSEGGQADCRGCGGPLGEDRPAEVGSFAANPYRLHGVSGGVREWVGDCWHGSYRGAPPDGSAWEESDCRMRVVRGGSWLDGAGDVTVSARNPQEAADRDPRSGFRVARDFR